MTAAASTRRGLAAVAALWLALIGGLVAVHEHRLRTGREVVLQTVPVDPRDLFRGDYVVLAYPMSALDVSAFGLDPAWYTVGQTVYVLLRQEGRHAVPMGLLLGPPSNGALFIRGQVTAVEGGRLRVEYGIESYFVPEGQGLLLERARGDTLEVVAVVDASGRAAIKALRLEGKDVTFRQGA